MEKVEKYLGLWPAPPNHVNLYQKKHYPWLYLSGGQVSWPNDSRFKIYTQKYILLVRMPIMMSQLSKFVEGFKTEKKEYLNNET